jgi:hypothetical protein
MAAQFKAPVADGDEIATAGGFARQTTAAGRNQRQRQRGGFDEIPAGSISEAHNFSRLPEFAGLGSETGTAKTWTLRAGMKIFFLSPILMTILILNSAFRPAELSQQQSPFI